MRRVPDHRNPAVAPGPPDRAAGRADLGKLADLIGENLYVNATRHRTRCIAVCELTLEATRRPSLASAMARIGADAVEATTAEHRALGLATSPDQVRTLITLFAGTLLMLVTGPPGLVTEDGARALAKYIVNGVLGH